MPPARDGSLQTAPPALKFHPRICHRPDPWKLSAYNRRMASADPITEFLNAVERARAHQVDTAPVVLATADAQGRPSARLVLLRGTDARGFVFFTNYNSRKGRELSGNPHAALCFYWASLDEQIRIEGR